LKIGILFKCSLTELFKQQLPTAAVCASSQILTVKAGWI